MFFNNILTISLFFLLITSNLSAEKFDYFNHFKKKLSSDKIETRLRSIGYLEAIFIKQLNEKNYSKYLPLFRLAFKDANGTVRYKALTALTNIGFKHRTPVGMYLVGLLKDTDKNVRYYAVEAMGNLNCRKATQFLLDVLKNDPDQYVRGCAASSLGKLNISEIINNLVDIALNIHEHKYPRICAMIALCKNKEFRNTKIFEDLLNDKNLYVRYTAIKIIGDLKISAAIKPLLLSLNDTNKLIQNASFNSLKKIALQDSKSISKIQQFALKNPKLKTKIEQILASKISEKSEKLENLSFKLEGPSLLYIHKPVNYTITINSPKEQIFESQLSYHIPNNFDYISSEPSAIFHREQKLLIWNFRLLKTIKIKVCLKSNKWGKVQNIVTFTDKQNNETLSASAYTNILGRSIIGLHVVSYDTEDPVEVGKQTTYVIELRCEGTSPATNIRLCNVIDKKMAFISAKGPTTYKIDGNNIIFKPVPSLQSLKTLTYRIVCKAIQEGSAMNTTKVEYNILDQFIIDQEGTTIYR